MAANFNTIYIYTAEVRLGEGVGSIRGARRAAWRGRPSLASVVSDDFLKKQPLKMMPEGVSDRELPCPAESGESQCLRTRLGPVPPL